MQQLFFTSLDSSSLSSIQLLHNNSNSIFADSDLSQSQNKLETFWTNNFNSLTEKSSGILAIYASEIVGVVLYQKVSEKFPLWEIFYLVVQSEFRGKGIATKLVRNVKMAIREHNGKLICLNVETKNISAIRCYNKNNFFPIYNFIQSEFQLNLLRNQLDSNTVQTSFTRVNQKNYRIFWLLYRQYLQTLAKFMSYNQETFNPEKWLDVNESLNQSLNYLFYKHNAPNYGFTSGWANFTHKEAFLTEIVSINLSKSIWIDFFIDLFLKLSEKGIQRIYIRHLAQFPHVENSLAYFLDLDPINGKKNREKIFLACEIITLEGNFQLKQI